MRGRNGDHEWLRMTNAFILCDLGWKVQKSHAANRECSFKVSNNDKSQVVSDIINTVWIDGWHLKPHTNGSPLRHRSMISHMK